MGIIDRINKLQKQINFLMVKFCCEGGLGGGGNGVARSVESFIISEGEDTVTTDNTYVEGYLDVFLNGAKLRLADYTAVDGNNIILNDPSLGTDEIDVIIYTPSELIETIAGTVSVGDVTFAPNARKSFLTLDSPLLLDANFVVDATNSLLGDELIIMIKIDVLNLTGSLTFPADMFYFTLCGEVDTILPIGGYERWVIRFTYDGEKFVNVDDNC